MESTVQIELWEHGQSGEVFAVRLNRTGQVTGMRGPLLSNQLYNGALAGVEWDEDPRDVQWLERHRESWLPSEHQSPPHY
jgi:hypothetical protein